MSSVRRSDYYFMEPGPMNTDEVIEAVKSRIKEANIKCVIVASDSGETALKVCKAFKDAVKVIAISWKEMDKENVKKLKEAGAVTVEKSDTPLSVKEHAEIRSAYYTLGQGFKVAVEVTLIAVDKGLVNVGNEVIAMAGTGSGADTAIIVKASSTEEMLGADVERRLEIKEVIAMPRKKKWWE